jgi:type II secretory pathway component PulC
MALDGSPMNDPAKAFELLNQLKTSSRMELTVKRNGKVQNFTYEIR